MALIKGIIKPICDRVEFLSHYQTQNADCLVIVSYSVIRIMLSGSPDDMKRIEQAGKLHDWSRDNLDWLKKTYGAENIVSAVVHLDETTPHIPVTMIPIVTGERRKAKAEQTAGKKKYRKKSTDTARLCADDVMSRVRLKEYQNTYVEQIVIYPLISYEINCKKNNIFVV